MATASQGLTFAEAYMLRKEQEMEDIKRRKQYDAKVMSTDDVKTTLETVKRNIEIGAHPRLSRNALKTIPQSYTKHVTDWHDADSLDILHLAIIHNRPAIVAYLLVETDFFPVWYQPPANPYCHLAAFAGNSECLKIILQYRPGSFFPCTKANHYIKLPYYISRALKANEKSQPTKIRVLEKIRLSTKDAEKRLKQSDDFTSNTDITKILDKDVDKFDQMFQKPLKKNLVSELVLKTDTRKTNDAGRTKRRSWSHRNKSPSMTPRTSMTNTRANGSPRGSIIGATKVSLTASVTAQKKKTQSTGASNRYRQDIEQKGKDKKDTPCHMIPRTKPRSGKHLITVYWDQLESFDNGVVKGAGQPVAIKYDHSDGTSKAALNELKRITSWHSVSTTNDTIRSWRRPGSGQKFIPQNKIQPIHPNQPRVSVNQQPHQLRVNNPARSANNTPQHSRQSLQRKEQHPLDETFSYAKQRANLIEVGIRGKVKYKEFNLKLRQREDKDKDDQESYINKTPLTLAAERANEECVQVLLDMVLLKRNPHLTPSDQLTLATKARSPETICLLLERTFTREDFQNAVLVSIREMYPVCLTALLSKGKSRPNLFDGKNLYHILYTQCVVSSHRYELMPEMTRALIACREDVNAHTTPRTFPMYTLINCAFNITIGKQILFFTECLHILLEHHANPHFDEEKHSKGFGFGKPSSLVMNRCAFKSAVNCVFDSAKNSIRFFEKSYWSKLFLKRFIMTIEMYDRTPRRILNTVLFDYMDVVCELGLDKTIVRCLLRYGANPDYINNPNQTAAYMAGSLSNTKPEYEKYAVNVYFDKLLPYLTRFEVIGSYDKYRLELDTLMIICRNMSFYHLSQALVIFLKDHLLQAPIQALPITRQFAFLADQLVKQPRPLVTLAARAIWLRIKRNRMNIKKLPISDDFVMLIMP